MHKVGGGVKASKGGCSEGGPTVEVGYLGSTRDGRQRAKQEIMSRERAEKIAIYRTMHPSFFFLPPPDFPPRTLAYEETREKESRQPPERI